MQSCSMCCRIWSLFTPFPLSLPEWEQPAIPCLFQRMTKYLILRVKMLQDITTTSWRTCGRGADFRRYYTGASNDIKRATSEARAMVTKYGMSDKIGLISYGDDDDEVFIGRDLAHTAVTARMLPRQLTVRFTVSLRSVMTMRRRYF